MLGAIDVAAWTATSAPKLVAGVAFVLIYLSAYFVNSCYKTWTQDFGHRLDRSHPMSLSNKALVKLQDPKEALGTLQDIAKASSWRSLLSTVNELMEASRSPPPTRGLAVVRNTSAIKQLDKGGKLALSRERTETMDMDHIRITFADFLWGHLIIAPCAVWMWLKGIVVLMWRQRLERWGIARPPPCDAELIVGKLTLEGIGELLNFRGLIKEHGRTLAHFVWSDILLLNNEARRYTAMFWVRIDVETKRMVKAELDGKEISAKDAIIIIWFDTFTASHEKLHTYGNWATNCYGDVSAYVRKASVVTVLYNYFGLSVFPRLCEHWYEWGWIGQSWSEMQQVIEHGGRNQTIREHSVLRTLAPYSEVTSFVIRVRNHFLNLFANERETFLGIDGEAFFIGTVLHSLDHSLMAWTVEDPLWLDITSEQFSVMAQVGRFVRAGFVDDLPAPLPWLLNKRYKTAPGRFFRAVYEYAEKLNPKFANAMDTCIVK